MLSKIETHSCPRSILLLAINTLEEMRGLIYYVYLTQHIKGKKQAKYMPTRGVFRHRSITVRQLKLPRMDRTYYLIVMPNIVDCRGTRKRSIILDAEMSAESKGS